jgi:hypothetical protein
MQYLIAVFSHRFNETGENTRSCPGSNKLPGQLLVDFRRPHAAAIRQAFAAAWPAGYSALPCQIFFAGKGNYEYLYYKEELRSRRICI